MEINESTPNVRIEGLIAKSGYQAFGKKVSLSNEDLTWLRSELNYRNRNGIYIFKSRAEKRKLTFKRGLVESSQERHLRLH